MKTPWESCPRERQRQARIIARKRLVGLQPGQSLPAPRKLSGIESVTRLVVNRNNLGSSGPALIAVSVARVKFLEE